MLARGHWSLLTIRKLPIVADTSLPPPSSTHPFPPIDPHSLTLTPHCLHSHFLTSPSTSITDHTHPSTTDHAYSHGMCVMMCSVHCYTPYRQWVASLLAAVCLPLLLYCLQMIMFRLHPLLCMKYRKFSCVRCTPPSLRVKQTSTPVPSTHTRRLQRSGWFYLSVHNIFMCVGVYVNRWHE